MDWSKKDYPNYSVNSFGRSFLYRLFYKELIVDVMWSGLAALVVYFYVIFHTSSVFVATFSM